MCFIGFSAEETEHMSQVLISNRGAVSSLDDPNCSHLVSFILIYFYNY